MAVSLLRGFDEAVAAGDRLVFGGQAIGDFRLRMICSHCF